MSSRVSWRICDSNLKLISREDKEAEHQEEEEEVDHQKEHQRIRRRKSLF
jgi:hypothetical protein